MLKVDIIVKTRCLVASSVASVPWRSVTRQRLFLLAVNYSVDLLPPQETARRDYGDLTDGTINTKANNVAIVASVHC